MQHRTMDVRTAILRLKALLVLMAALTVWNAPTGALAATSLCSRTLHDFEVSDECLHPSKVGIVEHRMEARPVRPVQIVWRRARLRLTELELRRPAHPLEIRYLFGHLPPDLRGRHLIDLSATQPHYVIVGELLARNHPGFKRVFHYPGGLTGGYWEFSANLRCGPFSLTVTSNVSPTLVREIGQDVQRAQACSK